MLHWIELMLSGDAQPRLTDDHDSQLRAAAYQPPKVSAFRSFPFGSPTHSSSLSSSRGENKLSIARAYLYGSAAGNKMWMLAGKAAKKAGLKTVIIPKENQANFEALPPEVKNSINVFYAETFQDIYNVAFDNVQGPN